MIITDEKRLRAECAKVEPQEIESLISTLEKELHEANRLGKRGVGLAAPQIGISKKIAIVRTEKFSVNLVNCEIKNGYDAQTFPGEGCLSFPGKDGDTTRFGEIHVVNNLVEPYEFICTGFLSVVVQHEIDHYNGVLFFDRLVKKELVEKPKINVKLSPNEPCICGKINPVTGKPFKFKKCCGRVL